MSQKSSSPRRVVWPWIVIGALACISFGWWLRGAPQVSLVSSAARARGLQGAAEQVEKNPEQRRDQVEYADAQRAQTEEQSALEPVADRPEKTDAPEVASPQENAGLPRPAKTVNAVLPRPAKKEGDLLPIGEKPATKRELSPREARDVALSVARADLELCLPGARGWAHMGFTVAADGSIEKMSLDAANGAIKACLRRRLGQISFRSGAYSTTHRLRIGAKSP